MYSWCRSPPDAFQTTPAGTVRASALGPVATHWLSAQVVCRTNQQPESDGWEVKVVKGWLGASKRLMDEQLENRRVWDSERESRKCPKAQSI